VQNVIHTQLGNYTLIRLLGHGGFADVYLGQHLRLHSYAAVKLLHTHLDEDAGEHFLREAQTLARLEHPHIVRILDYDVQNGMPFLVMTYAPYSTLRERFPRGTSHPLSVILPSVKQVAEALQYAHTARIIHRDIKPENMLIGQRGEVLLSDFGIATIMQSTRTSTQNVAGTMAYMAPEQILAHPHPASDQYALGVVVYEWLTSDRPFHGTPAEIAAKHLSVPPPSLRVKVPSLPQALEKVVLKALAKDPEKRFEHVLAFVEALELVSDGMQFSSHHAEPGKAFFPAAREQPMDTGAPLLALAAHEYPPIDHLHSTSFKLPTSLLRFDHHDAVSLSVQKSSHTQRLLSRRTAILAGSSLGAACIGVFSTLSFANHLWQGAHSSSPLKSTAEESKQASPSSIASTPTTQQTNIVAHTSNIPVNTAIAFSPVSSEQGILVHLPDTMFVAYGSACTHEGVAVDYDPATHVFVCPAHGAMFDPAHSGSVVQGPATKPLNPIKIAVHADGTITVV